MKLVMVEKSMMTDQTAMLIVFLCFVFGIGIGIFTCIYFSKKVSFYNYYRLVKLGASSHSVVVSLLLYAEFGPNDHQEDASQFTVYLRFEDGP